MNPKTPTYLDLQAYYHKKTDQSLNSSTLATRPPRLPSPMGQNKFIPRDDRSRVMSREKLHKLIDEEEQMYNKENSQLLSNSKKYEDFDYFQKIENDLNEDETWFERYQQEEGVKGLLDTVKSKIPATPTQNKSILEPTISNSLHYSNGSKNAESRVIKNSDTFAIDDNYDSSYNTGSHITEDFLSSKNEKKKSQDLSMNKVYLKAMKELQEKLSSKDDEIRSLKESLTGLSDMKSRISKLEQDLQDKDEIVEELMFQKNLEESLKSDLEHKIKQLTIELERSKDQINRYHEIIRKSKKLIIKKDEELKKALKSSTNSTVNNSRIEVGNTSRRPTSSRGKRELYDLKLAKRDLKLKLKVVLG